MYVICADLRQFRLRLAEAAPHFLHINLFFENHLLNFDVLLDYIHLV